MTLTAPPLSEELEPVVTPRGFWRHKVFGGGRSDLGPALLFVLPAVVGFGVFFAYPAIRGIYLSFTNYSLLGRSRWLGFDNYSRLLEDPIFWNSLRVTGYYVVINIVVQTIVALGLALLMDRVTKSTLAKGIILLPYLIAPVVVALLWLWMLDPQLGIINKFLESVGLDSQSWFGNAALVIPTIALVNVWKFMGYTALLIYAGLQTIPPSLYEAASLDGATGFTVFRRITLPLLRPVLVLVLITSVVGSFQVFDTVAVTSRGGPGNASRVIQYYIYDKAFGQSQFGYASAISVVLFLILITVALLQFKFLRGRESDLA
jgi:multiple sugar transport system permease protein